MLHRLTVSRQLFLWLIATKKTALLDNLINYEYTQEPETGTERHKKPGQKGTKNRDRKAQKKWLIYTGTALYVSGTGMMKKEKSG